MTTKERIQRLRSEGKTYRGIEKILGVSRSLVAFHLSFDYQKKHNARQNKNRFDFRRDLKLSHGGKCFLCGYNRCLNALVFHHTNPQEKKFHVSEGTFNGKSQDEVIEESKKCVLLCSNCHYEIHAGIVTLKNGIKSFVGFRNVRCIQQQPV